MIEQIKYKNYRAKVKKMSVKQAKKENAFGLYYPTKSTIFIQNNLNPKNYLNILIHEIAHFIAHKSKTKLANKGEEGIAEFIGSEFSKIFLQNPKLINIIKHCIKKNENN